MVFYDRATGRNPAAIILGVPGAGKSFSAKREMINVLLSTQDVIYCIDPQGEYNPIVDAMAAFASNSLRVLTFTSTRWISTLTQASREKAP